MDSDKQRDKRIKELGLPEHSTWANINDCYSELYRKNMIKELGLPENSTWSFINVYNSELKKI